MMLLLMCFVIWIHFSEMCPHSTLLAWNGYSSFLMYTNRLNFDGNDALRNFEWIEKVICSYMVYIIACSGGFVGLFLSEQKFSF